MSNYHPFVIPFCIGALVFFIILLYKFIYWIYKLDKSQKNKVLKNSISFKSFAALWETVRECLFHRNIFKTNPILGYMHLCFAFGWFLLIVIGKIETVFYSHTFWDEPWLAIFFRFFENTSIHFTGASFLTFVMDFCLLFVLSGLVLALVKRCYSKLLGMKKTTKLTLIDKIALSSLWSIFPLRLLAESTTAAIKNNGGFLTQTIGDILTFLPVEKIELPLWWFYSIALCTFFVLIPFTRYMHIFTEILLVFLRKWGVVESNEKTGYTAIELNACSRCGICLDVCPLNTEANINDIQAVYFIKGARYDSLSKHVVENCLMCGRCVEACPVNIKSDKIRQIYRKKENFNQQTYYPFIEKEEKATPKADIIYFAGCMTHLTSNIIISMKKIVESAHQSLWFMDEDKTICCGRPLRQQGFEQQANTLKEKNTALILQSGIKTLVTSCPICYQSFKKEYQLEGITVLHHSQYIAQLLKDQKIKVSKEDVKIAYHDPCELGRGCNIYQEPRDVIQAIATLAKVDLEKQNSLCCGYNLGNAYLDLQDQMKIKAKTLQNLCKEQPENIATACPMCKRALQHGSKNNVKDIAELVADKLI